ncbi:hypothetical protein PoB_001895200 [Plakobranchus ocellatus]|uniref:Uncharacterized protein n=1 Tax=Plakobranchus ocellatus TaxID=259542 RepID=A0AAV3ZB14_9GAST|nr:hypothetical protein PoB_001895200 [Plakobranchus ocellatus]
MFPWDDRGDGHPSDTTLLNTLAPVLVAHGLLTHGLVRVLCEELGDQNKVRSLYFDRAFNSSSIVRPEICRDSFVSGSSSATGTLPDRRPESLRSPYCGLALYTNQTKPRL